MGFCPIRPENVRDYNNIQRYCKRTAVSAFLFYHGATAPPPPQWAKTYSLSRLHDHSQTHYTRWDSSGRVISPTQKPLPDNTQHTQQTDINAPRRNSNPQPQRTSGRRPTPQTERTLGSAEVRMAGLLQCNIISVGSEKYRRKNICCVSKQRKIVQRKKGRNFMCEVKGGVI